MTIRPLLPIAALAVLIAGCSGATDSATTTDAATSGASTDTTEPGADAATAEDAKQPGAADATDVTDAIGAADMAVTPDAAKPMPTAGPMLWGPAKAVDEDPDPDVVEVTIVAYPEEIELLPGVKTVMWTYNGQVPGPLIEAKVGDRIIVHFTNRLTKDTTIHWHGMRVPNAMDGSPMTQGPVVPYGTFDYDFVATEAGTFWYHPHVSTHIQVERGLYAPLVVREVEPPAFDAERMLVLDDVLLDADGQIGAPALGHMETMHGRFGNTLLLNGKPVGDAPEAWQIRSGSVERWRILNTANARSAELDLQGASWRVIGTDGGLIPQPYAPKGNLRVAPGERYELEVRWEPHTPESIGSLRWHVPALDGDQVVDLPVEIVRIASTEEEAMPSHGVSLPQVTLPAWEAASEPTMTMKIEAEMAMGGQVVWKFNGLSYDGATMLEVPLGVMQTIDVVNTTNIEHPLHIHGHFFQVALRNGKETAEPGLKDTVWVGPEDTVRLVMPFDNPGMWMYHCHILEHAESGMMGIIDVM